jgi:hypothetical protein
MNDTLLWIVSVAVCFVVGFCQIVIIPWILKKFKGK